MSDLQDRRERSRYLVRQVSDAIPGIDVSEPDRDSIFGGKRERATVDSRASTFDLGVFDA